MIRRIIAWIALLLYSSLVACTRMEEYASKAFLETETAVCRVPADALLLADPFGERDESVYDTLLVRASRSWTVSVQTADGNDWVHPLVQERVNVSGAVEAFPLVIRFDRHTGDKERQALLTFRCAGLSDIPRVVLTQEAFVPVLELDAAGETTLPALDAHCQAIIRCNTSWTARIDADASSVIPSLDASSGKDTKPLLLRFPDNFDDATAKVATLIVEAAGCEPRTLRFVQRQSSHFWYLDGEVGGLLSPLAESVHIPLHSNAFWTAEISDCTFENAYLEPASGTGTVSGLVFRADHGFDPTVAEKHATVTLRRDGHEDLVVSFSQRGSIHLNFGHYNPDYTNPKAPYTKLVIPFSSPSSFPTSYLAMTYAGIVTDCVMKNGAFVFTMYGTDNGIWYNSTGQLWMVGKTQDDYILFPAVEGYRLAGMYYEASCRMAVPYTVRTADGSAVIPGGEYTKTEPITPVNAEFMDLHEHIFPETKPGIRYRLNLEETGSALNVKDLCLIYEPAE